MRLGCFQLKKRVFLELTETQSHQEAKMPVVCLLSGAK
jgi:hypothetical protein